MIIEIKPLKAEETYPWILEKHYAKRIPPISYAFGIFKYNVLSGIVTYGTPASSPLREGVCGKDLAKFVLELNRLCCIHDKNAASMLVSRSIKMLPKPSIIISYADTHQGHVGYVYQACNFMYTGLSAKRTDWKIKGMEHLHGQTVADMSKGKESRAEYMRERFGDDFFLEDRPRKHRYIYIHGSKSQKKAIKNKIAYDFYPYPKGKSKKYDDSAKVETQIHLI